MIQLEFQVSLVEGLAARHTDIDRNACCLSLVPEPAHLTEYHFVDNIPDNRSRKCVFCAQDRANGYN